MAAHAVGWPIPRGGSQSITNALCSHLSRFGCSVKASTRVENLAALPNYDVTLCDVGPHQMLRLAGHLLSERYKRQLAKYRYGPGVFKVDYALQTSILGKRLSVGALRLSIWAETWERSPSPKKPCDMGGTPNVPSFCWLSQSIR